jgi:hypothetical protein
MKRLLVFALLLLAACATASSAVLVDELEPSGCEHLGSVGGKGVAYSEAAYPQAVRAMQKETRALGGNYLFCCQNDGAVVLSGFEGYEYRGEAYRCPNGGLE